MRLCLTISEQLQLQNERSGIDRVHAVVVHLAILHPPADVRFGVESYRHAGKQPGLAPPSAKAENGDIWRYLAGASSGDPPRTRRMSSMTAQASATKPGWALRFRHDGIEVPQPPILQPMGVASATGNDRDHLMTGELLRRQHSRPHC
jgi:hypothetical protein